MILSSLRIILYILAFFCVSPVFADNSNKQVNVELFLSSTCVHCQKASAWFDEIEPDHPWLHVQKYMINEDKSALELYYQRLKELKTQDFNVPAMIFCGNRWTGFDTAEQSGARLLHALEYCHDNMDNKGAISSMTSRTLQQWSKANMLQERTNNPENSRMYNLIMLSLADAFSSCAFFCLAALMTLIFQKKEISSQLKISAAFIIGIFGMHYFQQFHAESYFKLLYMAILPGMLIAILMIYRCFIGIKHEYIDIPLVLMFSAVLFAWQQSCSGSWAETNAVWLSDERAGMKEYIVYQIVYIVPIILVTAFGLYCSNTSLYLRYQKNFFTASTAVLLAIALFLLVYPSGLANNYFSWVIPGAFLAGWIFGRSLRRDRKDGH